METGHCLLLKETPGTSMQHSFRQHLFETDKSCCTNVFCKQRRVTINAQLFCQEATSQINVIREGNTFSVLPEINKPLLTL